MCAKVEAAITQTLEFVVHFKWPLAGGLRARAHLIVGQNMAYNGWRYGLVKADHYRPIKEQNLIQPLLTIPLVIVSFLSGGK